MGGPTGHATARGRWALWLIVLLGVLVYVPRFAGTFFLEDAELVLKVDGSAHTPYRGPFSAYYFEHPDKPCQTCGEAQANPWHQWWESDSLRFYGGRPLTSLSFWCERKIFGRAFAPVVLVGLLLWAGVLVAAARVYRTVFSDSPEGRATYGLPVLATAIYAFGSVHSWPAIWMSARSDLFTLIFSLVAVEAHARYRARGHRTARWLSLAAMAIAFAGGESAIGGLAWIFAYEVSLGTGSWGRRVRAFAPFIGLAVVYVGLYQLGRYGIRGALAYADPVNNPAYFAVLVGRRIAHDVAMDLGLRFFSPSELAERLLVLGFGVLFAPRVIRDRSCRFAALGIVLSAILATMSWNDYNISSASVGTAWLFATTIDAASRRLAAAYRAGSLRAQPRRLFDAALLLALVGLRFVVEPYQCVADTLSMNRTSLEWKAHALEAELPADAAAAEQARILFLNSSDNYETVIVPYYREIYSSAPWPGAVWSFTGFDWATSGASKNPHALRMTRVSETSFELEAMSGPLAPFPQAVEIGRNTPFTLGEKRRLGALDTEVVEVREGNAMRLAVHLDKNLDDRAVWLIVWDGERYSRVKAPDVGQTTVVGLSPHSG